MKSDKSGTLDACVDAQTMMTGNAGCNGGANARQGEGGAGFEADDFDDDDDWKDEDGWKDDRKEVRWPRDQRSTGALTG